MPEKTVGVDEPELRALLGAARAAANSAYAPFSKFRVGAAVLMSDDPARTMITGANVENSSYGLTNCAERSAIFNAVSKGFRRLRYVAISCADALNLGLESRAPCGACRQVISEFSSDDTLVLIDDGHSESLGDILDVARLLPFGFRFVSPPA